MKKLILLTLLLPLFSFGQGQMTEEEVRDFANHASEQELLIMSSQMIQNNYLYQAEICVDKLINLKPESANYNYRKGYLKLGVWTDWEGAIPYLRKAITNTRVNYDMYSIKEEAAAVDSYFHLARCYHLNEQLDSAKYYYRAFLENTSKKSELIPKAELMLVQCDVAAREIANPRSAVVKNIGPMVNTADPEYSPVVSLDGGSLYFTSRRGWADGSTMDLRSPNQNQHPEDVFVSYADFEGNWTEPSRLDFCVNDMNEATISVSSDEKRIFIYQDITDGGDIYFSDVASNDKFEYLDIIMFKDVNTKYWETHCTMTPDGQNFYFVSDRPGGFGGRDIYRIVKLPNGEWSQAQNLGPGINTEYDEDSPFIAVDNKTLYFASNGPSSMGGFDIFMSIRDNENNWSSPINLGYPINSTNDDIYYTTTVDGYKGYLSSFRKGGYGEKDIYEIQNDYLGHRPISAIRGRFIRLDGEPVGPEYTVKLKCPECNSENQVASEPRMKSGGFFSVLERCKTYSLEYYDGDKLIGTEDFTTLCSNENEEIFKVFYIGNYDMVGTVSDVETLELLQDSKVEFLDINTDEVVATLTTDEKGAFTSDLLADKKFGDRIQYNVKVSREGYIGQTFALDTVLGEWPTLKLEYLINKADIGVDLGAIFDLNPIYFDLDKSNIRPDAAIELDKIVKIMNENPEIKIELGSHTDCRASKSYNMRLSNRRAKSSAEYIQSRITNPERIYGKGYGESKLVNDCGCEGNVVSDCTEEEHQANRRTEFRIVE